MVHPGHAVRSPVPLPRDERAGDVGTLLTFVVGGAALVGLIAHYADRPGRAAALTAMFVIAHLGLRTWIAGWPPRAQLRGDILWMALAGVFLVLAPLADPGAPFWVVAIVVIGRGLTLSWWWPRRLAPAFVAVSSAAAGAWLASGGAEALELLGVLAGVTALTTIMARRFDTLTDGMRSRHAFFHHADALFFEIAPSGVVMDCNPGAEAALGRPRERLVGRPIQDLYVEGSPESDEATLEAANGQRIAVQQARVPLTDAGRDRVVLVQRDVTAERRADEAEQRRVHLALEQARAVGRADLAVYMLHNVGNALNGVTIAADSIAGTVRDSRREALDRFVRRLGEHRHELADWFAPGDRADRLVAYLATLSDQLRTEQIAIRDQAHAVSHSVERLRAVIRAQEEWTSTPRVTEAVRLADVVDEALIIVDPIVVEHDVEVVRAYQPDVVATTDRYRVLEIVVTLIGNALDAVVPLAPHRRSLTLRVLADPEPVIEVTDRGEGIPEAYRDLVFTQGFSTKPGGTGMGLHVAALTAQDLSARLVFQTDGSGTTFRLTLARGARTPV